MDIVFSSTTQLAAAIRAGRVSATEVLEAYLAQIATHNPTLNAIITMNAQRAYERAREADKALARGEVWGAAAWRALYAERCPCDGGHAHHHRVPAVGQLCAPGRQPGCRTSQSCGGHSHRQNECAYNAGRSRTIHQSHLRAHEEPVEYRAHAGRVQRRGGSGAGCRDDPV